jgi:D-alanine-D-alanine ligase
VSTFDTAVGRLSPEQELDLLRYSVAIDPPEIAHISELDLTAQLAVSGAFDEFDVVFLALHGGSGENGTVQAVLDSAGVRYTGSGQLASAIALDKDVSKRLFEWAGVPTPDWIMWPTTNAAVKDRFGFPAVVKPNTAGSTIGLSVVRDPGEFDTAIKDALRHDREVIIEPFIEGREITVGVLDGRPLPVGEIIPGDSEIFDYRSKYQVGGAIEIFPAELTKDQTAQVQELALRAHQVLKLGSYSRVDFRLDHEGRFWCLEANTLPGMTATSLLPQSASAVGIDFPRLCEQICVLAMRD